MMKRTLLVLMALCISFTSDAKDNEIEVSWLPKGKSSALRAAQKFQQNGNAAEVTTEVLSDTRVSVIKNTVRRRNRSVIFYPSYNDAHESGTITIYWDQGVENLTLLEAGVLTPEGEFVRANADNIRVVDSDSYNTFTDQKVVTIPLSGVTEGSLSYVDYEVTYKTDDLEMGWSESVYPVGGEPVKEFVFEVVTQDGFDLPWSSTSNVVDCAEEINRLICKGENLEPYRSDSGVIWRDVMGQIIVGQYRDWKEVYQESSRSFFSAIEKSDKVKSLVSDLTKGLDTQAEKIEAIFEYAARDIRYVSMSELGNRVTPHKTSDVFTKKFGDCKDKTALLIEMLQLIGVDAFPTLVATERTRPEKLKLPSGTYFDHIVACFYLDDERRCLDPTDTTTNWSATSSWIQGAVSFDLLPNSQPSTIPLDKHKWHMEVQSNARFDDKANYYEDQTRRYIGTYAGTMRKYLIDLEEKDRYDSSKQTYQSVVSTLVEPKFDYKGLNKMEAEVTVTSKADYEPFIEPQKHLDFQDAASWVRNEISSTKIKTQYYDAKVDGVSVNSTYSLDVGPNWSLTRLPPSLNLRFKYGALTRTVKKLNSKKIAVITTLSIPSQRVKVSEIEKFNEYMDLLYTEASMPIQGELVIQD